MLFRKCSSDVFDQVYILYIMYTTYVLAKLFCSAVFVFLERGCKSFCVINLLPMDFDMFSGHQ